MDILPFYACASLVFVTMTSVASSENDCSCDGKIQGIGCYNDSNTRNALPHLILTDRDPGHRNYSNKSIDWRDWDNHMRDLVCRCAVATKKKGYKIFGIQNWGECWAGSEANYERYGPSTRCATNQFKSCTQPTKSQCCVGKANAYYVYKLEREILPLPCADKITNCPDLATPEQCKDVNVRKDCSLSCRECNYACAVTQEEVAPTMIKLQKEVPSPDCSMVKRTIPDKKMSVYLSFEAGASGSIIPDDSLNHNEAVLGRRALIFKATSNPCGQAAFLFSDDITFDGNLFNDKPLYGVTVAMWVRLNDVTSNHVLFVTEGTKHQCVQYLLEVHDGTIMWMHRNQFREIVFRCPVDNGILKVGKWFHIAGLYDAETGVASVYINGIKQNTTTGSGELSQDWGKLVSIGDTVSGRPVLGMVDEFRIYNYALSQTQILPLVSQCGDISE